MDQFVMVAQTRLKDLGVANDARELLDKQGSELGRVRLVKALVRSIFGM